MSKKQRLRKAARLGASAPQESAAPVPTTTTAATVTAVAPPNQSPPSGFVGLIGRNLKAFAGSDPSSTCLWSRWLLLRGIGLVFVIIFAGIISSQLTLAGPHGLVPLANYLQHIRDTHSGGWASFLSTPSLFWISSDTAMIELVAWSGMVAALALVLNLWPRAALTVCWLTFLAFVSTWHVFSAAQLDGLMLETALLCIPFAPAGYRPGLGQSSPPAPIATFMIRWLLFRVMFESGIVKIMAGDPHWRDFTAMDILYETSPFPTLLGYLDHQLPHAWHVIELLFTFFAELAAPLLALFGGRRSRWIAFISWTLFQIGIQLTNNFGWLNTASIALGLVLLDDQMLISAAATLRMPALVHWLSTRAQALRPRLGRRWLPRGFAIGLSLHFVCSLFYLAKACGARVYDLSPALTAIMQQVRSFGSVNEYSLYARFNPRRYQVEFLGSNDGGKTWRPYHYRYMPQAEDEIDPFIAPWFIRFDASLEIAAWEMKQARIYSVVAASLLQPNPAVVALFRRNPFPDAPPTLMRMRGYWLSFTDFATHRKTGRYWTKTLAGDYEPPLYVDGQGQIRPFDLSEGQAQLRQGDIAGAIDTFTRQYQAGYHAAGLQLVDICMRAPNPWRNPDQGFKILTELANQGEAMAENSLGLCYEQGLGTPVDYETAAHWYRRAINDDYPGAAFFLGALYANDRLLPRHDVEALALLLRASSDAQSGTPMYDYIQTQQPILVRRLKQRMSPTEITRAKHQAAGSQP